MGVYEAQTILICPIPGFWQIFLNEIIGPQGVTTLIRPMFGLSPSSEAVDENSRLAYNSARNQVFFHHNLFAKSSMKWALL